MPSWLRSILAVSAGIVAGVIVVSITDATTHALYPLPEGTDVTNREALAAAIATIPTAAFVISIAGWTRWSATSPGCCCSQPRCSICS